MLVVSNTSPVMNLAIVGELELLRQQFRAVIVPSGDFGRLAPSRKS